MAELVPNPDGCSGFAPNAFKREKCKQCGRAWTEHKDAIDDTYVQEFLEATQQKEADDRQRQEESEKGKQKSKGKKAKKRPSNEDSWFMDESNEGSKDHADSSDDDMGFQMISPASLANKAPQQPGMLGVSSIKNLIDFEECDVADDDASPSGGGGELPSAVSASSLAGPSASSFDASSPMQALSHEELLAEVDHLRHMLADAREAKEIELAIVQDEVAEQRQLADELRAGRVALEACLAEARQEMQALRARAEESQKLDAPLHTENGASASGELERLRAEVAELRAAGFEAAAAEAVAAEALRAAAAGAEAQAAEAAVETARLREELAAALRQPVGAAAPHQLALDASAAAEDLGAANGRPSRDLAADVAGCHAEAYAVAQQMGRQATDAFREIRLNAEQQLAWLSKFSVATAR